MTALPCAMDIVIAALNYTLNVQGRDCDRLRVGLHYNALSWSSGRPFVTDAAPIPLSTIPSSSEPGVTRSRLFKSGRGFFAWLSWGKRAGGLSRPLLVTDSVSEISEERFPSVMEEESSGRNKERNSSWHFVKDGPSFCYCAYALRISRWSDKLGFL